jgi:hypothetical protein
MTIKFAGDALVVDENPRPRSFPQGQSGLGVKSDENNNYCYPDLPLRFKMQFKYI